jgi:SAM-dependent methyltransferase
MRGEDFEYLYNLEDRYWWFPAMRRITDTIVAQTLNARPLNILDAGCGTGYNLRHYRDAGHNVAGFDIAPEAVSGVRRRGFEEVCQASVTEIPLGSETFDVVFSFDVICQVPFEQIQGAIREMVRVLKPGGHLFVRVPAFEWLRSSHDSDLHTQHRFTLPELRSKVQAAGLEVRFSTYANCFLFPVVVVRRFLKKAGIGGGTDVKPLPAALAWADPIFKTVLSSESKLFHARRSLPFGLSVLVWAQKKLPTASVIRSTS